MAKREREKLGCPVCRTNIKQVVAVKVIDNFIDKVYKHFEDKQAARTSLQEERLKLKKKEEKEAETLKEEDIVESPESPETINFIQWKRWRGYIEIEVELVGRGVRLQISEVRTLGLFARMTELKKTATNLSKNIINEFPT